MKCPRCGADVPEGNQFCGICGQPMLPTEAPPSFPAQPPDTCGKCGANLEPGAEFCGTCGEPVPGYEEMLASAPSVPSLEAFAVPRRRRPSWMWLLIGAGIICFLCGAVIISLVIFPEMRSGIFAFLERTPVRSQVPTQEATVSSEATSAISPTSFPSPTATRSLAPSPTPTPEEVGLRAAFAGDVTIPDNTLLKAGQRFRKTWRIRNSGPSPWPKGVRLVYVTGDNIGEYASDPLDRQIPPGEEVEVTIPMTAPTEPGVYKGSWQMRAPGGEFFGAQLFVVIQVAGPGATETTKVPTTPTPTPLPVEVQFEYAWNGNWIGIENRGVWAKADNGHQYVAELSLVSSEESLAKIEKCLPAGRRMRVIVRKKVAWVACTGNICHEHSQADDGQITNQLYLAPVVWTLLVNDYLAGGWSAAVQNPFYDDIQMAVFEPAGLVPDVPCLAFRFTQME